MIQDIFPCRLDHAFRDRGPEPEDCFFSFRGGEVLLRVSEDGSRRFEKLSRIRKWLLNYTPKRLFRFRRCSDYSIEALKEEYEMIINGVNGSLTN